MKKSGNVKKMAMGGRSLPPNPRRPLAQAIDMPRPRAPLPRRTGKMAAGGMPPRDIGTGAGPRRPLAQAIDMPRPRSMPPRDIGTGGNPNLPRRTGKMAAGGMPNPLKGVMENITAPSTGGGGRRPLAQAIDKPRRVQIDKGYGNEGPRNLLGPILANGPRRPLPQAIDMPRPRSMPPRDIGTGSGPRNPGSMPRPSLPPRDIGTGSGPRGALVKNFNDFLSGPKDYKKKGGVVASKMGSVRTASPSRDGIASKGKTKGAMVKMGGVRAAVKGGKC